MANKKNIMLTCKKATELIEMQQESPLSFLEKMQLNLHLKLCLPCKNYSIQSKLIDKVFSSFEKSEKLKKIKLTEEEKKKILKNIKGQ